MDVEYIMRRVCAGNVEDPRVRMGKEKERGNEEREKIKKNLKEATVCIYREAKADSKGNHETKKREQVPGEAATKNNSNSKHHPLLEKIASGSKLALLTFTLC